MSTIAATLLMALAIPAASTPPQAGTQIAYRGTVARLDRDRVPGDPEKTFDLTFLVVVADAAGTELFWVVDERGRGGWAWPERFGRWKLDAQLAPGSGVAPTLLFDRDEGASVIKLEAPLLRPPAPLAAEAEWQEGQLKFAVAGAEKLDDRDTWKVAVTSPLGQQRTVWAAADTQWLAAVDQRIFMGQGEEWLLQLRLVSIDEPAAEEHTAHVAGLTALEALVAQLGRPQRTQQAALNERQLNVVRERLADVEREATRGPALALVETARRDLEQQSGRVASIAEMVAAQQGREVEAFSVNGLAGARLSAADLRGQVTVLHFWDYRDAPLQEPYGQVGYLEFLFERRKEAGVKVYGVAVNRRLAEPDGPASVARSATRLKNFMHLTYPIVLDDGALLKQFGDPRLAGAQLPVYVVIGRDGRVCHYAVGFYEVDRDVGLKPLDDAVQAALQKKSP
ncbi:MAG: peroxiredoxin family protein [Pirellulales bacterium]